jgi:hypothetical protein
LYGGRASYLDRDDWSQLHIKQGKGVFITFGCNGCQLKGADGEGYGVAAMRNPNGPTAVAGSHGICFASMVQQAADGLFESTFAGSAPERLSDSWLAIKNGVARSKIDDFTYRLLDAVDGDKSIPQATQREEHLEMFLLLGDPALSLPRMAEDVKVKTVGAVSADEMLTVTGTLPRRLASARVWLTLERTVNSEPSDLEAIPSAARATRDQVILCNHERANRFVLIASEGSVKDLQFQGTLVAPKKMPWRRSVVRAYAANEQEEGMAVQIIQRRDANRNGKP